MNEDHLTIIKAWPKCCPFCLFITHASFHFSTGVNYKLIIHTIVSWLICHDLPLYYLQLRTCRCAIKHGIHFPCALTHISIYISCIVFVSSSAFH